MKLRYSSQALDDLEAIFAYLHERNPKAAASTILRIRSALRALQTHPEMGRPGRIAGTRELVVTGTGFIAAYRIHEGAAQVLMVAHGSEEWPQGL